MRIFLALWVSIFLVQALHASTYSGAQPLTTKEMNDLIHQFGPIIYFHPKEKYFPQGLAAFAQDAYAECFSEARKGKKIIRTSLARYEADLPTALEKLPNQGRHCIVALKKDAIRRGGIYGAKPDARGNITAPAYVNFVQINDLYCVMQFAFFYAYNGPTIQLGKIKAGTHEGDWEHADVHIYREDASSPWALARVHYAAHNQRRGEMREAGSFILEDEHPVGYAAKYGHATLARVTRLDHNLDSTARGGPRWDCSKHYVLFAVNGIVLPEERWWGLFEGRWGNTREGLNNRFCNSPEGPTTQGWWRTAEHTRNTYRLIDDPDATGGVELPNTKKGTTRSFVFYSPSRLRHEWCVDFYTKSARGELLPIVKPLPPFRVTRKSGLTTKVFRSEKDAFSIRRAEYGKNFNHCFVGKSGKERSGTRIMWENRPYRMHSPPLVVKLVGFEFTDQ